MRVGFLGTGAIAAAMVRGLAGQGHEILVSERSRATSRLLAREVKSVTVASNFDVVDKSDTLIICLLAADAPDILATMPFRENHSIISVMADAPIAKLQKWCAPSRDIAIAFPLPAIAFGNTHLPCFPESKIVKALFGARNSVITVQSEIALNAQFAVTALCSPMLAQMIIARDWLAQFTQDPEVAEGFVHAIMTGCARDAGSGFEEALASQATEGGLNATLRARLQHNEQDLSKGLDAFRGRLNLPDDGY